MVTSRVVRGGGESLKKYVIALVMLVAMFMLAPAVSAGPNGGWGKGLLSETLEFCVGDSNVPSGFMYWSPETADFMYDFHGYYLDASTCYYLIAYGGSPDDEPTEPLELGSMVVCEYLGVHIKGAIDWPDLTGATVCLVPDTYSGFGGEDDWMPDTYQVAWPVDLPG